MGTCRIVIADDHALFRKGLKGILGGVADLEVVGEAGDGL
jgi:DNA-binding NarL/FixJ family response regulator